MKIAQKADKRIQLTSEVLSSIGAIKTYAWERYILQNISVHRR